MEIKTIVSRPNRIKKIAIIGGGTAGWMTAAAFSKVLREAYEPEITLVESEEIGIVGVGEATIPQINTFNRLIGLDPDEFLKRTKGTFKLGIEFIDWFEKGKKYFHPFGPYGIDMAGVSFHAFWLKMQAMGMPDSISDYNLQAVAARNEKFMRPVNAPNSPLSTIAFAYHFDASLYAKFLREKAELSGVTRIEGKINNVRQNSETGFIEGVDLDNGKKIDADLFIDCSGLHGLLIEKTLKTGYIDWSEYLPANRAWAVPCESKGDPLPFTRSIARDFGWQWRIPLQHRIGNGYVFSNKFVDEDKIKQDLLNNLDGKALAEPRLVKFTTGRREKFWNKNCIAIGLSSGFLEPLESTSIHLIQTAIAKTLQLFPDKNFDEANITRYNKMAIEEYEVIRDFIILHYNATKRDDTVFWNYVRNMKIPDRLQEKYDLFKSHGRIFRDNEELFNDTSWFAVMIGQGMMPKSYDPVADLFSDEETKEKLYNIKNTIQESCDIMPKHMDFIKQNCLSE